MILMNSSRLARAIEIAFEFLRLDLGLPKEKAGAAQHNLAPMLDVTGDGVLEGEELRLAVINRQHVDG